MAVVDAEKREAVKLKTSNIKSGNIAIKRV